MVIDRIFLMLFNTAFVIGTCAILFEAPALYDYSEAIDKVISTIARAQYSPDIDIWFLWGHIILFPAGGYTMALFQVGPKKVTKSSKQAFGNIMNGKVSFPKCCLDHLRVICYLVR